MADNHDDTGSDAHTAHHEHASGADIPLVFDSVARLKLGALIEGLNEVSGPENDTPFGAALFWPFDVTDRLAETGGLLMGGDPAAASLYDASFEVIARLRPGNNSELPTPAVADPTSDRLFYGTTGFPSTVGRSCEPVSTGTPRCREQLAGRQSPGRLD